ncbi:MAG TPA: hydroxyacylglutathione hydrolase [Usitatibacteraceae bacterium]
MPQANLHGTIDKEVKVAAVPAFNDNYLWVVHDTRHAIVVDPGDASPIIDYLTEHQLGLRAILCTHHHADHVGGVEDLLDFYGLAGDIPVYGPGNERIPQRTDAAREGDVVQFAQPALKFQVIEVPGHTAGHIAYFCADQGWLFCGDTLFACGCGRLFEGTAKQMQTSLAKLKALPSATQVFCAHEYTLNNIRFAEAVEPANAELKLRKARDVARREQNIATVPFTLAEELATNPFLRWDAPAVRAAAGQFLRQAIGPEAAPDLVFGAIREWKNAF